MDLLQIRYFQKVAELQHMTKAAQELHIAQPSLSKTIHTLEAELGTELFNRQGKYIALNEAGQIFLQYANIITDAVNDVQSEIEEYKKTGNATLDISLRVAPVGFPQLIARFHEKYPTVKFKLEQHQHLLEDVARTKSDFTVFSTFTYIEEKNQQTILEEPLLFAMPLNHPLADRDVINMREIDGIPLVGSAPSESNLRTAIRRYCRLAGITPNFVMDSDDYATVKECVRTGIGCAFIPAISWRADEAVDQVHYARVTNPDCKRCITISWKTTGYIPKAAVLFRQFAIDYYKEHFFEDLGISRNQ